MSNPTFRQGPISFEIAADLDQFRLVALNADGKLTYAGAEGAVFGAVTETGRADYTGSSVLPVHYGVAAVDLEVDGDASEIKAGDAVYAAANGKASASGTVQVGVAASAGNGGRVLTVLNNLPTA